MSASEQSNSSLLIGVVVSALTHVAALYSLRHIEFDRHSSRISTASFSPAGALASSPANLPKPDPLPPEPPPVPPLDPAKTEPPKPKDFDKEIRFGNDNSTIESMTWLGTEDPTTPSGKLGEVDQAQLSPDPGPEGTPGSPFVATVPRPPSPGSQATVAAQPGVLEPTGPLPSPTSPSELVAPTPREASKPLPTDPALKADPDAEKVLKPKDAPLPAPSEAIPPTPGSKDAPENADPLAEKAGQGGDKLPEKPDEKKSDKPADAAREGEKVPPSETKGTAKDPKDSGKAEGTEAGKPNAEKGQGIVESSPVAKEESDATKEEAKDPTKELLKETSKDQPKDPPAPDSPVAPPVSSNPGAPSPDVPATAPVPPATGSPIEGQGDGGQAKLQGRTSEQESEAFTSKPIVTPMRDATVQAGKGLKIITRRAVFTNTTLVTQAPRDTLIRIRFQRDGTVKKADFVDGGSTGNPNIDEPIRNAVYRWRASGKDLDKLSANDTLSVVVRITFR